MTAKTPIPQSTRGRIWVLEGSRLGDNSQVHALAARLATGYRTKKLSFNSLYAVPNILLGATIATLDKATSDELHAPWPDIVISAGRRSVPVARWIKAQNAGRTRLVQIGRPRAPLDLFDLVLTTPQYGLPPADNVIELPLPLVPLPDASADHRFWERRFKGFAHPWIGLLVGGAGHDYSFDEAAAHRLAASASRLAHQLGGSLLVSTSPRTGRVQSKTLQRSLVVPGFVHHWTGPDENPHQAILALADRFIVTCDSVSMIAEACATGKPVELFDLPEKGWRPKWQARSGITEKLARLGILSPPRNIARVHRRLLQDQRVTWLDQPGTSVPRDSVSSEEQRAIELLTSWLSNRTKV